MQHRRTGMVITVEHSDGETSELEYMFDHEHKGQNYIIFYAPRDFRKVRIFIPVEERDDGVIEVRDVPSAVTWFEILDEFCEKINADSDESIIRKLGHREVRYTVRTVVTYEDGCDYAVFSPDQTGEEDHGVLDEMVMSCVIDKGAPEMIELTDPTEGPAIIAWADEPEPEDEPEGDEDTDPPGDDGNDEAFVFSPKCEVIPTPDKNAYVLVLPDGTTVSAFVIDKKYEVGGRDICVFLCEMQVSNDTETVGIVFEYWHDDKGEHFDQLEGDLLTEVAEEVGDFVSEWCARVIMDELSSAGTESS